MRKGLYKISESVVRQTIENKGCTIGLKGNFPEKRYMVSLKGKEQKINILDFAEWQVNVFILRNSEHLCKPNHFIGTWVSEDIVYLDLSVNLSNRDIALACGKANGQICIWDNEKKVEIYQLEEII